MATVTVYTQNGTFKLRAKEGMTLYELLAGAGYYIDAPCGGNAKCAKCLVKAEGALSAPSEAELKLLGKRQGRMACLTKIYGDCEIYLSSGEEGISVSIEGEPIEYAFSPWGETPGLGAAIDIGTTTVVCYLYDLSSGLRVATTGGVNRQRSRGADVISRISHCMTHEGGREELSELIWSQLSQMLSQLAERVGKSGADIVALSVAGNTTMSHLFAGLNPKGLSAMPFKPESMFGEDFMPDLSMELGISPRAEVFILPAVSAFVGGDIAGAALAAGLDKATGDIVLIDIGTNGEIVLASGGNLYSCATAAGPAFEGADISCGMGGTEGAIGRVYMCDEELCVDVIGDVQARGICGSGLIDALALMLDIGAVDETGRLLPRDEAPQAALPFLEEDSAGDIAFALTENVRLTGRDIRKLQLAKAAIAAGTQTLLDEAGISPENVDRMYIAGGFGNHINAQSAGKIGLYPMGVESRSIAIGNAAGMGAAAVLCSAQARTAISELARAMKYIDLSSDPRFMVHYVEQMMF